MFGLRCVNPRCGYKHWDCVNGTEASFDLRKKIARLFEKTVVSARKLELFNSTCRTCCRFSLLCYERDCTYSHHFSKTCELGEDCRIKFKKVLQKFLKTWKKGWFSNLSDAEFETRLDEWIETTKQQMVRIYLDSYKKGEKSDWFDIADDEMDFGFM